MQQHAQPPIPTVKHLKRLRIYVLVMTALCGLLLYMMVHLLVYKGKSEAWPFIGMIVIILCFIWSVWPTAKDIRMSREYHGIGHFRMKFHMRRDMIHDSIKVKRWLKDQASMDRPE